MAQKLNITHHYDRNADILYVDFGFDEPCYTESTDGVVMIDIGWFTKLPRGLRIISPSTRRVKVNMVIAQAEKTCRHFMEEQAKQIATQEPVLSDLLAQTLNQAFMHMS
jgi:hypothetical protein